MAVAESSQLHEYCLDVAQRARRASGELATVPGDQKQRWLERARESLLEHSDRIATANQLDLDRAGEFGLSPASIDRLRLTPQRIEGIRAGLAEVAALADPVGEIIESSVRPNGLDVQKVRVPLGVVFFIYESRPNVTVDAAGLCVKSGNAVILRGGKEAAHSNQALAAILRDAASDVGLPEDAVQLVSVADREAVGHFLSLADLIDVTIPRGGEGLIRRVAAEAKMPVIKHFAGNCHVYIDASADPEMAQAVTVNSKCQRLGVCNTAESLLVHTEAAEKLLPRIGRALQSEGIEIRGDARVRQLVPKSVEITAADDAAEYLAPIISARVVESLDDAVHHINRYGSHHTDTIVTSDYAAARRFTARVDSAAVIVNASTRFNDGGEFGLGAEIGISTDKFHARGPCGLRELTSYKYVVFGQGQIRQ